MKIRSFNWHRYVINGKIGERQGIYRSNYIYAKTNKRNMKFNNENNESSYIQYCDVGNLYG